MSIAENFEVIADAVYEKGKKDEYDKFWDEFQSDKLNGLGKRANYNNAFSFCWSFENFYPKYDIQPTNGASQMFYGWSDSKTQTRYSLKKRLEECGVTLDTSKATSIQGMFNWNSLVTEIPTIDMTSLTSAASAFAYCTNLITIEKFIVNENTPMTNWFGTGTDASSTTKLENLEIEGKIGQSGFRVSGQKKLTKESILSILKALSLNITETKTITFSTAHQSIIEMDPDCKPYWEAAKNAGWSFVYA